MGDIFGQYAPVRAEQKQDRLDSLIAYEEHYMRLIRSYKSEIEDIRDMLEQVRREREEFYRKLPEIERVMKEDGVISDDTKRQWIAELRDNMERSFAISENLINHYVTSNLDEFKRKMKDAMGKV